MNDIPNCVHEHSFPVILFPDLGVGDGNGVLLFQGFTLQQGTVIPSRPEDSDRVTIVHTTAQNGEEQRFLQTVGGFVGELGRKCHFVAMC